MLEEYQVRAQRLSTEIEQFVQKFVDEHPDLTHNVDDAITHLKKGEQDVADSLGEWLSFGEQKIDQIKQQLDQQLERLEETLSEAIAKF